MADGDANLLNEELERQSAWMRRLVRKLVGDGAGVDDVVQEAQLAALRRERAGESVGRGWLARAALNFARKRGRDNASRRAIEQNSARAEALPSTDELVARLDAQRELANELRALPEPYRSTLVRRFFDNWSAARIAREAGCPASTARTRIDRGLELLRERLDRRHGGRRREWLTALAPLALPRVPPWLDLPSAPVSKFIQGVVVMKVGLQIAAVCAALVVVGVGWLWSDAPPEAASPAQVRAVAGPEPVEAPASEPAPSESVRTASSVATPPPAETYSTAAQEVLVAAPTSVELRVVDGRLLPIARARIRWADYEDSRSATTNAEGRARLEAQAEPNGDQATLRIEAAGFAVQHVGVALQAHATVSLGDVVLERAGVVAGRVQHADGRPMRDALVLATAPALWNGDLEAARRYGPDERWNAVTTRSLADGEFRLEGLAPGGVRVWAEVEGLRYGVSESLVVKADEVVEGVVLVVDDLKPEDEIAGVVLDPDGLPAAGASLQISARKNGSSYSWSHGLKSDGSFRFRVRLSAPHDLRAQDHRGRWTEVALEGVAPGEQDVRLQFEATRYLSVAARDADGADVSRFELRTLAADGGQTLDRATTPKEAEDRARIRVPGRTFLIECDAPGFALARLGPFDPHATPASLEFRLEPIAGLTGRVLANGAAVSGARVTLWRPADKKSYVEVSGYPALRDPHVVDEFVTSDDGTYFLRVERADDFIVRAESNGYVAAELGPVHAAPGEAHSELDLVLGHGGALEGRVIVAPGRSDEGVIVAVNRGDGYARTTRTRAGGAYSFDALMPGRWSVQRGRSEIVGAPFDNWAVSTAHEGKPFEFNCDVLEGRTTTFDLDLRDDAPAVLRGKLTVDGAPASAWTLRVWPGDRNTYSDETPSTALDAHGEFVISIEETGPSRLSFSSPAESGGRGQIETVVELRSGENNWSENVETVRLRGRSSRPSSDALMLYLRIEGERMRTLLPLRTAADGSFDLPAVPVGRVKVYGAPIADGMWGDSELLREFELTRGSSATIEF